MGPHLVYVGAGALYVGFLCQMGPSCECDTDEVFCVFLLRLVLVFSLFRIWVPANQESPKLVEMVSNKPYSYVW